MAKQIAGEVSKRALEEEAASGLVPGPDLFQDPALYINRELSLLEFQRRVLEEAEDVSNALLERVKFLSIVGSNLDEFFMVRVAGLKELVAAGVSDLSTDGLTPGAQLRQIRKAALQLMAECRRCLNEDLLPALKAQGIHIKRYYRLSAKQKSEIRNYFEEIVFPVLTPLAFDPGRPFPHISNLSLNLAVLIQDRRQEQRFARIKVPGTLPRLVPVKGKNKGERGITFTWLEDVVAAHLSALFPGMKIIDSYPFRVTRNADLAIQELEAGDLLESIEEQVRRRRFGSVVRVTVNEEMPRPVRDILIKNLELNPQDVYSVDGILGLGSLMSLYSLDRHDLKDPGFHPASPLPLRKPSPKIDLFSIIQRQDILLHHPYDSFAPVVDFLKQAATDPDVLAIKQTLYRVGKNSPVVEALLEARQQGKQVAVLVELKARFDEESNIHWARALEREGVHVIYGLLGLKTHSKIALVVRKEEGKIRRYVHLATGNYNAVTASLYTDLGMFTCDEEIGADATDLFNYLTGYSDKSDFQKLLVAPINLRSRLNRLIEREVRAHQKSGNGHLIFVMNSLVDNPIIQRLYHASQQGVRIDLVVRGICCLRPGVPGISDNIRVTSIVGRFLEHSRAYYFNNGGAEEIYLGSADLMPRNINSRVEVLFPVQDQALVSHLRKDVLGIQLADRVKARKLNSTGAYTKLLPKEGESRINSQEAFLAERRR